MNEQFWFSHGYEEVETADQTPSLKSLASPVSELMHHRGGALTESREIYGRLIRPAFRIPGPRFLSLGLGLGYNEALIAEEAIKTGSRDWACVSYEADPVLIKTFLNSLSEPHSTYEKIFARLQNPEAVKSELRRAHQEGRWILEGALGASTRPPFRLHGFLWDAFSQKTSPELWEEGFLTNFLKEFAAPEATALSTYACIGKLKRALSSNGFTVKVCEGFLGKRNSTFAWRGEGWTPSA